MSEAGDEGIGKGPRGDAASEAVSRGARDPTWTAAASAGRVGVEVEVASDEALLPELRPLPLPLPAASAMMLSDAELRLGEAAAAPSDSATEGSAASGAVGDCAGDADRPTAPRRFGHAFERDASPELWTENELLLAPTELRPKRPLVTDPRPGLKSADEWRPEPDSRPEPCPPHRPRPRPDRNHPS